MKSERFRRLLREVASLTRQQRSQLADALRPAVGLDKVCEAIDSARPAPLCCPSCGNSRHYRHGFVRGLQRYRCRACSRTFSALSGTPLARLRHRSKWLDYGREMLESRSVRAAAKLIGVHRNTSFRSRHRFLDGVRHDQPERLAGIAEADEMFCSNRRRDRANWSGRHASAAAWRNTGASATSTTASWLPATAAASLAPSSRDARRSPPDSCTATCCPSSVRTFY